jgi:membrane-bound lytic murein transglycosylase A
MQRFETLPNLRLSAALAVVALAACASPAPPGATTPPTAAAGGTASAGSAVPLANAGGTPGVATPKSGVARVAAPSEVRTRNAVFKLANFDELPGWQQDDLRAGWGAFRNSCEALQKRDEWREICDASRRVPATDTAAMRGFFESRFSLLRILNTDASREGDITGYFEPLLEGQRQRSAVYNVPVLGVPRDLYTIDWSRVPKAQRRGVIAVRPDGNQLAVLPAPQAGSYAMDLRRFELDDRDRRLRVRLAGSGSSARAEPYYTRAELEALNLPQDIGAPVIAWVNDGLALYAMQVQGSGRIRLPDGSILRVQYAEQNGHPFKPLRVAAVKSTKVVTRGTGAAAEQPQEFVLEDDAAAGAVADAVSDAVSDEAPVVTRGGKAVPATAAPRGGASDSLVDQLLGGARPVRSPAAAGATAAKPPTRAAPGRLVSDPSYVFFKPVADRPASEGPQGALGVPLTAGRSVAVDPRVTPLGYPVFLSAPAPSGSAIQVQRLVFAQDTGGAIRGAVRADYFWGFGSEAGQNARSTKHRGQMWVLLPTAEAKRLSSSRIVTRGGALASDSEPGQCLVADGDFCSEVD